MTPYELANQYLQPFKTRGEEIIAKHCPFCHGGEHHDKDSFAMNLRDGVYNCRRGSCGERGGMGRLMEHLGVHGEGPARSASKRYTRPSVAAHPMTTQAESYLASRKISKVTMDAYGVGCDGNGNIMFPFNRNGELVFVKYRPAKKVGKGDQKAWREKDTEPILFGMDCVVPDAPLVICEGEIDALSLREAGVENAVSVPSGASDMSWIDTCWDFLEGFASVVMCGDADSAGREMVDEVVRRLGTWRCKVVELPEGRKDANETLYFDGPDVLRDAVASAKDVPTPGLIRLADVRPQNALTVESVGSGIHHLDAKTGGFLMGELSVWTGKRSSGKSTLIGQTLLDAIDQGYRVCAYSGELKAPRFQNWIDLQAAGPNHVEMRFSSRRDRDVAIVTPDIREQIHAWYADAFYLYDNTIVGTQEERSVLEVFELAVRRYGCRVFLVDNLMTAMDSKRRDEDIWAAQGVFVGELAAFSKRYNVHVHLAAHPRKSDKSSKNTEIDGDDIAGSSQIIDRADNAFAVKRCEDFTELRILKNREDGAQYGEPIGLQFCPKSRRLLPPLDIGKTYGWELPEWARNMNPEQMEVMGA